MPKIKEQSMILYIKRIYFLPLKFASDLVANHNYPFDTAVDIAFTRFAKYGRHNQKTIKGFSRTQFEKCLRTYLSSPDVTLAIGSKPVSL